MQSSRVKAGSVKNGVRVFLCCCALGFLRGEAVLANKGAPAAKDENAKMQQGNGAPIQQKDVTSFTVIGIAARTTNARESGPNGVIPQQWQKLFQEGVLDKIPE